MRFFNLKIQKLEESIKIIDSKKRYIFISVSGYETRSTFLFQKFIKINKNINKKDNVKFCILGFDSRKSEGNRLNNNKIYKNLSLDIVDFSSSDMQSVKEYVLREVEGIREKDTSSALDIHLDYSSMPRLWYCGLFQLLNEKLLPNDTLYMWYSEGKYSELEFPTASMDGDINIFSGAPTLAPLYRTHLLGLGFDRTRASAIFRVLDPQHLVCFYGGKKEYIERAISDNRDLIDVSDFCFEAPLDDFPTAFSKLVDVTRELSDMGDVILVPDGPKPLVLASFLVPGYLKKRGLVVFHIKKHSSPKLKIVDVSATGEIYGFSVSGLPSAKNCD